MGTQTCLLFLYLLPFSVTYRLFYSSSSRMEPDLPENLSPPNQEPVGQESFPLLSVFKDCISISEDQCPNENVTFWLYTRDLTNPWQIDIKRPKTYENMPFSPKADWKVIIHGYTGNKNYDPNPQIRPALLELDDYNIISVDYSPLVQSPCYLRAVKNVPGVSKCVAQFLDFLIIQNIMPLHKLHIIAFSLGSQVAGHLSNYLQSGKIPRISGLDPAAPSFYWRGPSGRLDSSDADFVDVIHGDGLLRGQYFGIGHVDFYPNGGYHQPGCNESSFNDRSSCNHARAVEFYAESITTQVGFWAVPCNSYLTYSWGWCDADVKDQILMGYFTPTTSRGNYYLSTNSEPPYAMGIQGGSENMENVPK